MKDEPTKGYVPVYTSQGFWKNPITTWKKVEVIGKRIYHDDDNIPTIEYLVKDEDGNISTTWVLYEQ